jgi:ABC-2 type transport system permease protein
MINPLIQTLILKDWRLHRVHILLSMLAGGLAIGILQIPNGTAFLLGAVWFFTALIVLGSMLPVSNVVNERKKQTAVFLMSLPLSAVQYAISKMVSTLGLFLLPWAALVLAGSVFILSHREVPHGIIPLMLITFGFPLVGFCLNAGAALISESEGWTIAATIVCNSSYGLAWYFMISNPAINGALKSPVAVWSPPVLMILGGEAAVIVLILGITFYLQSKKREFV